MKPNENQISNPDPTGYRVGIAPSPKVSEKVFLIIET